MNTRTLSDIRRTEAAAAAAGAESVRFAQRHSTVAIASDMPATFKQIQALQARSGRNLKDCKEALNNHDCDIEAALNALNSGSNPVAAAAAPEAINNIQIMPIVFCASLPP